MGLLTTLARVWLTRSFKPFHFTNKYENTLNYQQTKNLGLYVHIPFCRTLCAFCPYCKVIYKKDLVTSYVEALLKEIDMVGKSVGLNKKEVTSLYFGGGTPALVVHDIKRIIDQLKKYFIMTDGIGLELHPRDITVENLEILKASGVTKISIGIQSFQKEQLSSLGREELDYRIMFEALSKVHFETVSMDFIFALPNQTIEIIKKDIEMAFNNGANHIAIYPFIDFTFTNRHFKTLSKRQKKKLLYEVVEYCEKKGYVRDSIWTFSKDGKTKYSSMTRDHFLGFGCSATTLLDDIFKINTFDIEEYQKRINHNQLPTALTLDFTRRQRMVYYLFWTAYSMKVDAKEFKSLFGKNLKWSYGFELFVGRLLGLVKKKNHQYMMTTKGSYYFHYYENFYTLSYIDQMWHLMKNEAFPKELIIK